MPRQAVGDEGGDALVAQHPRGKVADDRGAAEAVMRHDDHVARLRLLQGAEQRQDVGGIGEGGQRRTGEGCNRGIERLDAPVQRAAPIHGVHQV
jgi:hypothetical protein